MSGETDGALAGRAAAGDRDALATLLERHYERITYRWTNPMGENHCR